LEEHRHVSILLLSKGVKDQMKDLLNSRGEKIILSKDRTFIKIGRDIGNNINLQDFLDFLRENLIIGEIKLVYCEKCKKNIPIELETFIRLEGNKLEYYCSYCSDLIVVLEMKE
jgi:RNase P subunit RPR2